MIRHIGSCALAALVALAVVSPGASAAEFHSSYEETALLAVQEVTHELWFDNGNVVCEVNGFEAAMEESTAETIVADPEISGCIWVELFNVTVTGNGCKYVFDAAGPGSMEGSMGVTGCNEGKPYIQIGSTTGCRTRIFEQSGLEAVRYEVEGKNLGLTLAVEGIEYEEKGVLCQNLGVTGNGAYFGSSVVSGNGEEAELWIE